jgi:hypothetical protein
MSTSLEVFTPSRASVSGPLGRISMDGRFPLPGSLEVFDADNALVGRFDDETGLSGHQALVRQAAWAAIHVADGRLEAPQHPLAAAVAAVRVIETARAQVLGA